MQKASSGDAELELGDKSTVASVESVSPSNEASQPMPAQLPRPTGFAQPQNLDPEGGSPLPPGYAGGGVLASTFVIDLGLEIQRGFRRKLLTILFLQLLLTMVVGLILRHVLPLERCALVPGGNITAGDTVNVCTPGLLLTVFPAQSIQTLILGAVCLLCLPLLTYVRDHHPWNMVCTTIWSVCWGVFLAAAHVPGGIVRSNALFVIFGTAAVGIFVLLILSTTFTVRNEDTGERQLWSFGTCGWLAWLVMTAAAVIFYTQTQTYGFYSEVGHYVGAVIVASLIFAWVAYDSAKLCERMQPDDYMKGVVYFYTDFLLVCCCCMFAGCLSSGGS